MRPHASGVTLSSMQGGRRLTWPRTDFSLKLTPTWPQEFSRLGGFVGGGTCGGTCGSDYAAASSSSFNFASSISTNLICASKKSSVNPGG